MSMALVCFGKILMLIIPSAVELSIRTGVRGCFQPSDLLESAWKRRNGLKDSGTIMPGHGGVMDRFDGFTFTVPVYFVLLSLLPFEFALKAILP